MTIGSRERSTCACGRPAGAICGKLEEGALFVTFKVSLCLKSGLPVSECRLEPPTASELKSMEMAMQQNPF